jgi:DUF1365 family protein
MAYIDLDAVPSAVRRRDHLGDPSIPLADAARGLVTAQSGIRVDGPVHLLTFPRRFGKSFSPVSFYYCFVGSVGERLEAIIAEVTSTPWGERHCYVLTRDHAGPVLRGRFAKRLHVSPYMGMNQEYSWRASVPGETVSVHIESSEREAPVFDATLALRRADPSTRATSPLRVLALIYGHAAALKLKGVSIHPRPEVA